VMRNRYRDKKVCEICSTSESVVIDKHHIIPRADSRSTDNLSNLAIICSNCHRKVHNHLIIIEGVFPTSSGMRLFWYKKGDSYTIRPGIFIQKDGTALIVEA